MFPRTVLHRVSFNVLASLKLDAIVVNDRKPADDFRPRGPFRCEHHSAAPPPRLEPSRQWLAIRRRLTEYPCGMCLPELACAAHPVMPNL